LAVETGYQEEDYQMAGGGMIKKPITPKKPGLRELKKTLWRHFSKWIRNRDQNICYTCDKPGNEAGHFLHSKGFWVHFDPRVVHCQCPSCNRWKHGNLAEYARRLVAQYGPGILEEFNQLKNKTDKPTSADYERLIEIYKVAK
jgi:hypothetical protein